MQEGGTGMAGRVGGEGRRKQDGKQGERRRLGGELRPATIGGKPYDVERERAEQAREERIRGKK